MEIQQILKALGDGGCYFLCILRHFGQEDEAVRWYKKAVGLRMMDLDCFIKRPEQIAGFLSKKRWSVRHEGPEYQAGPREWLIERYERKTPVGAFAHFVLPDWDPLGQSLTRTQGTLVSKRVFKEIS